MPQSYNIILNRNISELRILIEFPDFVFGNAIIDLTYFEKKTIKYFFL